MRTFERYLNRRNITDIKLYFISKGIETDKQLEEWCGNNSIEAPLKSIFGAPVMSAPVQSKPIKSAKTLKVPETPEEEETWHTPAAERPLRKSVKKPVRTKRKGKVSK
jgi:hypothetical protein